MNGMLIAGGLIGTGLFLVVREALPARPSLDAAVERSRSGPHQHGRLPVASQATAVTVGPTDWRARAARKLALRISGSALDMRIPRKDLSILDKSVESYLAQKITALVVGLFGGPLFCLLLRLPFSGSVLATLVLTSYLFVIPDVAVRSQAKEARNDFKIALVGYLELVSLAASAGKGPSEALEAPLKIGDGWVFKRLASCLDPARRGTRDTWVELDRLATDIGVQELSDIATIARRAGAQGVSVLDSLRAKAASLRADQHAATLRAAKSATETMTVPMVVIVAGFMILIGYPAFSRLGG